MKPLITLSGRILLLLAMRLCAAAAGAQEKSTYDAELTKRVERSPQLTLVERHVGLHADIPGWALGAVSGVAAGRDGQLYVMQRGIDADPVCVFDGNGKLLRSWGRGDFTLPHSLRLDTQGNVWAIDAGTSSILEYSATGSRLLTIHIEPVPDTGSSFRGATDLAFAPNGNVLITDGYGNGRVLEYTTKGEKVREWGSRGSAPGQFDLPHSIQISSRGTVYVADRENGRIEVFHLDGKYARSFDGLGRCYSLALRGGALWISMGPRGGDPGTPGWLIKMDPKSGRILGHLFVPDDRAGHAIDLFASGKRLVETAGSGLLLFSAADRLSPRDSI